MRYSELAIGLVGLAMSSACALPSDSGPPAPPPTATASFPGAPGDGNSQESVLIYSGVGIWTAETDSLREILYQRGVAYEEIDAPGLDSISLDDLSKFSLIIFSGGYAPTVATSVSVATHAKLRAAVQQGGVSYLGFCAGAWLAVAPAPAPGQDVSYGFGVVDGPILEPNYLFKQGLEFAISRATFPEASPRDLLWYGGPITPLLPGGVVARYADGTPAISQMKSGNGFVIVSGLHPAATKPVLTLLGLIDREAVAPDYAWTLLNAAIEKQPLPAFP